MFSTELRKILWKTGSRSVREISQRVPEAVVVPTLVSSRLYKRKSRRVMTGVVFEDGVWDGILRIIRKKLNGETFETWFNPIEFRGIDRARLGSSALCAQSGRQGLG